MVESPIREYKSVVIQSLFEISVVDTTLYFRPPIYLEIYRP